MGRACVWIRLLWCLVAVMGLWIVRDYVDQGRYLVAGSRPCMSASVCILMNDTRTGEFFWMPLPDPPSRDIIPDRPVPNGPRTGV